MTTAGLQKKVEPWRKRLYLPAYGTGESARYAGVHTNTIRYWEYGRNHVRPVVSHRERRKPLSYLQLVEVAFVATFRALGVSLAKIRDARDYLGQTFEAEYPFSEYRLLTEGMNVLMDLQQVDRTAELDRLIIANRSGQMAWRSMVGSRFTEFKYEYGLAIVWNVGGSESDVAIDPRVSFGAPNIGGIPTWAIRGRWKAGEEIGDIASDFGMEPGHVHDALKFEGIEVPQPDSIASS